MPQLLLCTSQLALGTDFSNCNHGEVRLVDGPNVREGRVEVCINNAWGTVCSSNFGNEDATVVCLSMEFDKEGILLN